MCASGRAFSATSTTGTKTINQKMGLCRTSFQMLFIRSFIPSVSLAETGVCYSRPG